jgi:hypothetical protein
MPAPSGSAAGPTARLRELGIALPPPPTPLGAYVVSSDVGSLLFLSGILPVVNRKLAHRRGAASDERSRRRTAWRGGTSRLKRTTLLSKMQKLGITPDETVSTPTQEKRRAVLRYQASRRGPSSETLSAGAANPASRVTLASPDTTRRRH